MRLQFTLSDWTDFIRPKFCILKIFPTILYKAGQNVVDVVLHYPDLDGHSCVIVPGGRGGGG